MMTTNHLSAAAYHAVGLAPLLSSHREQRSPGCACLWCRPALCELCALSHTNPNRWQGCLDHALQQRAAGALAAAEVTLRRASRLLSTLAVPPSPRERVRT